jgi:hypothetical protein
MALFRTGLYVKNHTVEQVQVAKSPIASYNGNVTGLNIPEMIAYIEAKQSGSGDPSPDNIRPIIGASECNVWLYAQNILNPNSPVYGNYTINPDGTHNEATDRLATGLIPCKANTLYTAITDRKITDNYYSFIDVAYYDENKSFISRNIATSLAVPTFTFTTPATAKYLVYSEQFNYLANVTPTAYETYHRCLVEGSASEYIPFTGNTYTIQLGDTYYGCYLNVTTGELTVTHRYADMGQLAWTSFYQKMVYMSFPDTPTPSQATAKANLICSSYKAVSRNEIGNPPWNYAGVGVDTAGRLFVANPDSSWTSVNDAKADLNGVQLVYELATPTTIQLTPTQIEQLLGQNNVWADTGDVEVKFYNVIR